MKTSYVLKVSIGSYRLFKLYKPTKLFPNRIQKNPRASSQEDYQGNRKKMDEREALFPVEPPSVLECLLWSRSSLRIKTNQIMFESSKHWSLAKNDASRPLPVHHHHHCIRWYCFIFRQFPCFFIVQRWPIIVTDRMASPLPRQSGLEERILGPTRSGTIAQRVPFLVPNII